jgi:protein-serine/threonine kinase
MIFRGQPWGSATLEDSNYGKFYKGYTKLLASYPDGLPDDGGKLTGLGPIFANLPKPILKVILVKMLHPEPEKRATIDEVLKTKYIKALECCCDEPEEDAKIQKRASGFDAGKCGAGSLKIKKHHNHLPPKVHRMQHRFDMGDGYS